MPWENMQRYAINLVEHARHGRLDPVIGRSSEILQMIRVLSQRVKNNPVIVGDAGVGKTALVEGLAQRIARDEVPVSLRVPIFSLDMGSLLSGTQFRGAFETRMKQIIHEISEHNAILFIDEIHTFLGAGSTSTTEVDASNLLKPVLARGILRCIGATTLEEYRKMERDPAFERRFRMIQIDEPSPKEAVLILRGLKEKYEIHHGVTIQDDALQTAVQLSQRYIPKRKLPDKAIELIDEACARCRVEMDTEPDEITTLRQEEIELEIIVRTVSDPYERGHARERLGTVKKKLSSYYQNKREDRKTIEQLRLQRQELEGWQLGLVDAIREKDFVSISNIEHKILPDIRAAIQELEGKHPLLLHEEVSHADIYKIMAQRTGIPMERMDQTERETYLHMEDRMKERVMGQEEAIQSVARAMKRSRVGLGDSERPIGSFMFAGLSGCGKTELAKTIAGLLFQDEHHMTRIDCSELMERHSVSRLIGAPPGYVGYNKGGMLTEALKNRPFGIVLFDEIEKAHPDIFHLLLQILDDGRITDSTGSTIHCKNSLFILTTNLGSEILTASYRPDLVRKVIEQRFRPEFLNRLDEIIVFRPLESSTLHSIIQRELQELREKLEKQGIEIRWNQETLETIAEESYHPQYGARPIRRYIEREIVSKVSDLLLEEKIPEGKVLFISSLGNLIHVGTTSFD